MIEASHKTGNVKKAVQCPMRVIGIGGAGLNILSKLRSSGEMKLIGIDTCMAHLNLSGGKGNDLKIMAGRTSSRGINCGGDFKKGHDSAKETFEQLMPHMPHFFHNCLDVFVFGLGGGAGMGGALYLLEKLHKERRNLEFSFPIICICPYPLDEEKLRRAKADKCVRIIANHSDRVFIVKNQKVADWYPECTPSEVFDISNKLVANMIKKMSYQKLVVLRKENLKKRGEIIDVLGTIKGDTNGK
jgi:cell division GTPase FtsZ